MGNFPIFCCPSGTERFSKIITEGFYIQQYQTLIDFQDTMAVLRREKMRFSSVHHCSSVHNGNKTFWDRIFLIICFVILSSDKSPDFSIIIFILLIILYFLKWILTVMVHIKVLYFCTFRLLLWSPEPCPCFCQN